MTSDGLRRLKRDLGLDEADSPGPALTESPAPPQRGLWVMERRPDGDVAWRLAKVLPHPPPVEYPAAGP